MQSKTFDINDGLRQGGVLSPTLFILVMDDVIKSVENKTKKVHIGFNKLMPVYLSECAFADDMMICAPTEKALQENLLVWEKELQKRKLKINPNKTKVMMIGKEQKQLNIELNQEKIEQVEEYKYLGIWIEREGNIENEIKERINSAAKVYHSINRSVIRKREISRKTKMTIYKTVFIPTLVYGSESWVLNQSQRSRLQRYKLCR